MVSQIREDNAWNWILSRRPPSHSLTRQCGLSREGTQPFMEQILARLSRSGGAAWPPAEWAHRTGSFYSSQLHRREA